MSELTQVLERARANDPTAAGDLLPLVYNELRNLAASKMARESPGQTLQPTALVHEAWLRLGNDNQPAWEDKTHFFRAAAEAMRRILVDRARAKATQKRHADVQSLEDSTLDPSAPPEEVLAVHDALELLAREDPAAAEVVKHRYFVGLTIPEIASLMGVSASTVDRNWCFARTWLKRALQGRESGSPEKKE